MNPQPNNASFAPLVRANLRSRSVEGFSQDLERVCGQFAVESGSASRGRIDGDVSTLPVSRFETAIVSLDAQRVFRDERMIRKDPGEHLFLLIQDKGNCRIHQNDTSVLLTPGDMYLVDSAKRSEFVYDGMNSRQISIHLPRDEMLHRFGAICTGGIGVDHNDPLFVAMRAVLAKIFAEDNAVTLQLGEAFLSLLGAYFRCVSHQEDQNGREANAVLSRALQLIERKATDPAFGPQALAEALQVSSRTLQRHFGTIGETASKRILSVRLETAKARLKEVNSDAGRDTIAVVAYDSGFNDLSHFYKVFRERFGVSPGAARKNMSP
ncbi:helix-turn-helix domain-containing protein [Roseibium sp. RKSG952]|uniref:helix-turn-helix domain-containing protein n=1 Tax=Roseibium sp. RKSG952 TaxID=2529384 RepID=UPI0012BBA75A|nr:helix-turn-helix domain-containing protein [Roseibium sp. RKSG952]MTI02105.1 helix-turn-helix domain-containing protein [Roseibium sp. RKSG952]